MQVRLVQSSAFPKSNPKVMIEEEFIVITVTNSRNAASTVVVDPELLFKPFRNVVSSMRFESGNSRGKQLEI